MQHVFGSASPVEPIISFLNGYWILPIFLSCMGFDFVHDFVQLCYRLTSQEFLSWFSATIVSQLGTLSFFYKAFTPPFSLEQHLHSPHSFVYGSCWEQLLLHLCSKKFLQTSLILLYYPEIPYIFILLSIYLYLLAMVTNTK